MGLMLDLPSELAAALGEEASQLGLSLPEYAVRILASGRPSANSIRCGSDLIDYWSAEGLLGSRTDIADSQTHARNLRTQAEHRDLE